MANFYYEPNFITTIRHRLRRTLQGSFSCATFATTTIAFDFVAVCELNIASIVQDMPSLYSALPHTAMAVEECDATKVS